MPRLGKTIRSAAGKARELLILSRCSNLPTVWSNCLAGWLLGGAGPLLNFFFLLVGASAMYTAGMFLNDAFDLEFDRQHRPERPIPQGRISQSSVFLLGFGGLGLGICCLVWQGVDTAFLTGLLALVIFIYDLIHKGFALAPILIGLCRFFLLLVAASVGNLGVTGWSIWSAFALCGYIIGLGFLARTESTGGRFSHWPWLLLILPLLLAWIMNPGSYRWLALTFALPLLLWSAWSLAYVLRPQKNISLAVSGLLAGIVWVDLLSVAGASPGVIGMLLACFLLAVLGQRYIPAT